MHACPNKLWNGCTHASKQFKYVKAFNKHVAKCNMARKQSETEEMDLRPLLKQVVSRLSQLEQQFAILKTENRHLREQMRAPTTRGSYEIRGTDTPIHGFGRWDTSLFLDYLTKTDEFIRERMGYGVMRMNFNMFVGAVFYIANGQTNLVRLSPTTPLDRNGYPKR